MKNFKGKHDRTWMTYQRNMDYDAIDMHMDGTSMRNDELECKRQRWDTNDNETSCN